MITAHDAAAYILQQKGRMPAPKLHKLLYYSQAWSLVWDEHPLFNERIEAWANGPVVLAVYRRHQGRYSVRAWSTGDPNKLDLVARETIDAVLRFYGSRSATWLINLTHREDPWRDARHGLLPGQVGCRQITLAAMSEYYSGLVPP